MGLAAPPAWPCASISLCFSSNDSGAAPEIHPPQKKAPRGFVVVAGAMSRRVGPCAAAHLSNPLVGSTRESRMPEPGRCPKWPRFVHPRLETEGQLRYTGCLMVQWGGVVCSCRVGRLVGGNGCSASASDVKSGNFLFILIPWPCHV